MRQLFLIIFFLFSNLIYANDCNGIYFEKNSTKASSVVIDDLPSFGSYDELILHFTVNFKNRLTYGNILHLYFGNNKIISLVYSPYEVNQRKGFILSAPSYSQTTSIDINESELVNQFTNMSLSLKSNELHFSIGSIELKSEAKFDLEELDSLKIIFGATPNKTEVTDFILKRLSVTFQSEGKKDSLLWSFDKFNGKICYDVSNRFEAEMIFAVPYIQRLYNWHERNTINFPKFIPKTFDEENSLLYSVVENSLSIYSLLDNKTTTIDFSNTLPFDKAILLKDNLKNQLLYMYSGLGSEVSYFNFDKHTWTPIDSTVFGRDFYGAAEFINPVDSMLYAFGGYGYYQFMNTLQRYDPQTKTWTEVKTFGSTISPRKPFIARPIIDSLLYIAGGIGSETGDQRIESKELSDLYSLNLRTFEIINLGELIPLKYNQVIGSLIYNAELNAIFFPLFSVVDSVRQMQFYKFELESKKSNPVGNLLEFNINDGYLNLHYSVQTEEFIAISKISETKNEESLQILSLLSPAVSKEVYESYIEDESVKKFLVFLIPTALIFIGIATVVVLKRKRITNGRSLDGTTFQNSMLLLGNFKLFDNNGNNIESNFSTKILEAFLIILLRSFKLNNHFSNSGITSAELASILWPDFEKDSQKNNRNVTINKIRHILENTEGLEVVYENSLWKIKVSSEFTVDLFILEQILQKRDLEEFITFVKNYNIGEFCKNVSYEWLDSFKISIDKYILGAMINLYRENKDKLSSDEIYQLGKVIQSIDELSEIGIAMIIQAHKMKSANHELNTDFKSFKKKFLEVTGEEYTKTEEFLENIII